MNLTQHIARNLANTLDADTVVIMAVKDGQTSIVAHAFDENGQPDEAKRQQIYETAKDLMLEIQTPGQYRKKRGLDNNPRSNGHNDEVILTAFGVTLLCPAQSKRQLAEHVQNITRTDFHESTLERQITDRRGHIIKQIRAYFSINTEKSQPQKKKDALDETLIDGLSAVQPGMRTTIEDLVDIRRKAKERFDADFHNMRGEAAGKLFIQVNASLIEMAKTLRTTKQIIMYTLGKFEETLREFPDVQARLHSAIPELRMDLNREVEDAEFKEVEDHAKPGANAAPSKVATLKF